MKKRLATLFLTCVMCTSITSISSITSYASGEKPFGDLPQSQTTISTKTATGGISPMFNDTLPYTATSWLDGYCSSRPWIGLNTYNGGATSKTRTADGSIRDVDYIYCRIRAYTWISNSWTLNSQNSATDANAADVAANVYGVKAARDSDVIFYSSHTYKEAGYADINHELSDSSF